MVLTVPEVSLETLGTRLLSALRVRGAVGAALLGRTKAGAEAVADVETIREGIKGRLGTPEDELLASLSDMAGEDHAVPQDQVRQGMRLLFAYLDTLRTMLCKSDTRALLKQDFERSRPALAAMLAADAYLTALGVPAQATVGALVLKLGVDRICSG